MLWRLPAVTVVIVASLTGRCSLVLLLLVVVVSVALTVLLLYVLVGACFPGCVVTRVLPWVLARVLAWVLPCFLLNRLLLLLSTLTVKILVLLGDLLLKLLLGRDRRPPLKAATA